jgi:O-antigen ligase/Tfp pilus assembly protein PilF
MVMVAKLIPLFFNLLLFFVPLIVFPKTSELFEFNKMVAVYGLTVLIVFTWIYRMILYKKVIFRRTILDIPLLIFLFCQVISTIFSIDPVTSLFGYYSRLHGGLLSSLSYALLYWAYVSNMDKKSTLKSIYFLLFSGGLASAYGVAQHFGVDRELWVQDVVNRVFSTLGQPNWLAAFLATIIPVSLALGIRAKVGSGRLILWTMVPLVFFLVLLYTKSRSGLIAFVVSDLIFWAVVIKKNLIKKAFFWHMGVLFLAFLVGTIWTPGIGSIINKTPSPEDIYEHGGTESGDIRKIVWKGAVEIWKKNPLIGSGVETFAYSYYKLRPKEHNLTSEWDYLYNKAHNEYLGFAANTGTIGLISYLVFILSAILLFKTNIQHSKEKYLNLALASGFSSILVSNFFGFSVVVVGLLFFLLPAFSVTLSTKPEKYSSPKDKLTSIQIFGLLAILLSTSYFLFLISKYWYADFLYASGKNLNDSSEAFKAEGPLRGALALNPFPTVYYQELASAISTQSVSWFESGDLQKAEKLAEEAVTYSQTAADISPWDLSLKKSRAALLIKLSEEDPGYLEDAQKVFLEASVLAPTDAKIHYNLGLTLARLGKTEEAISTLEKTVKLKSNYRDARFALALLYLGQKRNQEARAELIYILEHVNPNDPLTEQQLEEIP